MMVIDTGASSRKEGRIRARNFCKQPKMFFKMILNFFALLRILISRKKHGNSLGYIDQDHLHLRRIKDASKDTMAPTPTCSSLSLPLLRRRFWLKKSDFSFIDFEEARDILTKELSNTTLTLSLTSIDALRDQVSFFFVFLNNLCLLLAMKGPRRRRLLCKTNSER